ncbi:alpha-mannosidase [Synechocystis sp. PCC 7509]|uniref:alpha-mannosidase n=1 Tax=Synechocystis sp. PCC 7509 TaxID=927677 RepID=UPI0002ABD60B|nr:alpha-mannosidase [Synechocystis sp. PCC 7509]
MYYLTPEFTNLLSETIARLRSLSQLDILPQWQIYQADISITEVLGDLAPTNCDRWRQEKLNEKGHIPWVRGQKVLWLVQKIVVPETLQNYPLTGLSLRLSLLWWAEEAQIFVDGKLVQEGDLFDCSTRILLSSEVTPKQEIIVALRLVSPSHDNGALVKSQLIYQSNNEEIPEPSFVADELAIVQQYLTTIGSNSPLQIDVTLDWSALPDKAKFEQSLLQLRSKYVESFSYQIKQRQIYLVGHAHLDLAWLWAISETWEVAARTFTSVLQLQTEYPQLTFCHSTPAIYSYIEQHCPDLFAAIQKQVTAGSWEVVGGLWVEPELNLIDGESIVRQLLYGQRYVLEKFGKISTVAWLPDTFGFCATLPQIFASGGIKYFVTQKLLWNDTTKFPHAAFWWRSPDGTELFSLMSAPIGEGIDPVKMATFSYNYEKQTNLRSSMWLPGVGDHGGGPTRDMLELAKRWDSSPLFPTPKFTTTEEYLQDIQATPDDFPVWDDELYLEFHRGCYTTHADQKRFNRRCEGLLYQAELFASLATISANTTYPKAEIEAAWKKTLINQFHDILPGSSIHQVYVDANADWQEVEQITTELIEKSLKAIASLITLPSPPQPNSIPVIVFNPLNWVSSQIVTISLPNPGRKWHVYNHCGDKLLTQLTSETTLVFLAKKVESVGYSLFWLSSETAETTANTSKNRDSVPTGNSISQNSILNLPENCLLSQINSLETKDWVLENNLFRVIVDSNSGDLASILDKINNKEILNKSGGNQLQAYKDNGQYWDAWNIDPNYKQYPLESSQLKSIEWLEKGAIQTRLRVVRQLGKSEFCCDYILQKDSPILKIATTVDFQDREVLVKAAFPFSFETDSATYEIPFGTISRLTKPTTPAQKAKWEVPALRWADLSNDNYGVSLLNDCKYGYDSEPNQLRLTLLRSASWPDPEADKGHHEFTYAIYPHSGTWQAAQTVQHGYELNIPFQVIQLPATSEAKTGTLPKAGSFLNLSADNLVITAFKQSEDNPKEWILRCYECYGLVAEKVTLQSVLGLEVAQQVDILEFPTQTSLDIKPWKIANFVIEADKCDRIS